MTSRPRHDDQRFRGDRDRDDEFVLDALARDSHGPDLTDSIMSRLGYRRVTRTRAAWMRVRSGAHRALVVFTIALTGIVGYRMYDATISAQDPAPVSVQEALHEDLEQNRQRLRGFIESIRHFEVEPPVSAPASPEPAPSAPGQPPSGDAVSNPISPFRWL